MATDPSVAGVIPTELLFNQLHVTRRRTSSFSRRGARIDASRRFENVSSPRFSSPDLGAIGLTDTSLPRASIATSLGVKSPQVPERALDRNLRGATYSGMNPGEISGSHRDSEGLDLHDTGHMKWAGTR